MPSPLETAKITLEADPDRGVAGGIYEVKQYPPPSKDDLQAHRAIIHEFKERFLHFVDSGYATQFQTDPDRYIEDQRAAYNNTAIPPLLREEAGRMLCTGLLARAFRKMEEHVDVRIAAQAAHAEADSQKLDELYRQFRDDMKEAMPLPKMVRKGGAPDLDEARIEMLGEPGRAFALSSSGEGLGEFYRGRTVKVALAMDSIKQLSEIGAEILAKYPGLAQDKNLYGTAKQQAAIVSGKQKVFIAEVSALFPQMILAVNERIQTLHGDPAYQSANMVYKATRNKILELAGERMQQIMQESKLNVDPKLSAWTRKQEIDSITFLQTAVKDIYDVAITHDPHPVAIGLLKTMVDTISMDKPGPNAGKSR